MNTVFEETQNRILAMLSKVGVLLGNKVLVAGPERARKGRERIILHIIQWEPIEHIASDVVSQGARSRGEQHYRVESGTAP